MTKIVTIAILTALFLGTAHIGLGREAAHYRSEARV